MAAGIAPRLVLILMWIVGPRINAAFDNWIWPLLGIIFLPYTTIMYVLVWNPVTGIYGWDWLWIGLGVWLDFIKWNRIREERRSIPGYPVEAEDEFEEELEKLAGLKEQGVITDEEFEEKKKQLLEL
jgi:hypothetical protein